MKPYLAVLSARFRMLLQYRAAAVAGLVTQLFWGLIRLMIFDAFYQSTRLPQPMTRGQVIDYIWLGQAFFALMLFSTDPEIRAMVRTGTVAYELVRPLDLYSLWFCRMVANRTAPTFLRSIPIFVAGFCFLGLKPPPTTAATVGWLLAMLGATLVGCALATLVHICLLWTVAGEGLTRIVPTLVYAFSGMIVPLPFYPNWMQPVLNALPFRDLVDLPFRIYDGNIPPASIPAILLAQQIAWMAALVLLGRFVLARGLKRLVVQGG